MSTWLPCFASIPKSQGQGNISVHNTPQTESPFPRAYKAIPKMKSTSIKRCSFLDFARGRIYYNNHYSKSPFLDRAMPFPIFTSLMQIEHLSSFPIPSKSNTPLLHLYPIPLPQGSTAKYVLRNVCPCQFVYSYQHHQPEFYCFFFSKKYIASSLRG